MPVTSRRVNLRLKWKDLSKEEKEDFKIPLRKINRFTEKKILVLAKSDDLLEKRKEIIKDTHDDLLVLWAEVIAG